MMQSERYILFDLDGTLTDSAPGIVNSVRHALKSYGIEEKDESKLRSFVGPPLHHSFQKHYFPEEQEAFRAIEKYREYYAVKGIFENELYLGIHSLLQTLFERETKLILATSKPQYYAQIIIDHFQITPFFHDIFGGNLDGSRTDKTEIIQHIIEKYPAAKQGIMVGDTPFDILGAKANGLPAIAVSYGYGNLEALNAAQPHQIVHSVAELQSVFYCA